MDNSIQSPTSTPPTTPVTSPLNSPSPITSPNLSSESKKILEFLIDCANQDRLRTENLVKQKNKIELECQPKDINSIDNEFLENTSNMTKSDEENKSIVKNKIIKKNKIKKKKNRCHACNKKLPLMPIICKCGFKFCCSHRHPEDHQCTFDHKTEQQNLLKDKNPQIISDKIIKI